MEMGNRNLPELETLRVAFGKDAGTQSCLFEMWDIWKSETQKILQSPSSLVKCKKAGYSDSND